MVVFGGHSNIVHIHKAEQFHPSRQYLSPTNLVKIIKTKNDLIAETLKIADKGLSTLVPTMGALHDGHLELIRHARKLSGTNGCVIVSLFVNPSQFDRIEDLDNYPRTIDQDLKKCQAEGVDIVFAPDPASMYQPNHSVTVIENSLATRLCGAARPGHFNGVCTIVLKLFNLCRADIAVFGKKDYQQLAIIRRMIRDLNLQIRIEAIDTVRDTNGVALSSRNALLTPEQYNDASRIRRAMLAAKKCHIAGETSVTQLVEIANNSIQTSKQGAQIDYLEILDADSLEPIKSVNQPAIMATAVFYGKVRLIDNIELG